MTEIWIGLADAVAVDSQGQESGGVYVHVLAPAGDVLELRVAADEILRQRGYRVASIEDAEPLRDRVRTGTLRPELFEAALEAAVEQQPKLGEMHGYPPDDHPDPDAWIETGIEDLRAEFREASGQETLVNVRSHYDWHNSIGYVCGIGSSWALLQLVEPYGSADGFRAIKLGTVAQVVTVDPEDSLLPRILRARPLTLLQPDVDLNDTRTLIEDVRPLADLTYLVTEDLQAGAFWIGRITALDEDGVLLHAVSNTGDWLDEQHHAYDTITRVGFGGQYEEALALAVEAAE